MYRLLNPCFASKITRAPLISVVIIRSQPSHTQSFTQIKLAFHEIQHTLVFHFAWQVHKHNKQQNVFRKKMKSKLFTIHLKD